MDSWSYQRQNFISVVLFVINKTPEGTDQIAIRSFCMAIGVRAISSPSSLVNMQGFAYFIEQTANEVPLLIREQLKRETKTGEKLFHSSLSSGFRFLTRERDSFNPLSEQVDQDQYMLITTRSFR